MAISNRPWSSTWYEKTLQTESALQLKPGPVPGFLFLASALLCYGGAL